MAEPRGSRCRSSAPVVEVEMVVRVRIRICAKVNHYL